MGNVNIIGNNVSGGSTLIKKYEHEPHIKNIYNYFDWPTLQSEAAELKSRVKDNDSLRPAVAELESAISSGKKESICSVVKKYAADFSTSAFANVAGAGLLALIRLFTQ